MIKPLSVPAFDLPTSNFLGTETRQALNDYAQDLIALNQQTTESCPSMEAASIESMPAIRQQQAEAFYTSAIYKKLTDRYQVNVKPETFAS